MRRRQRPPALLSHDPQLTPDSPAAHPGPAANGAPPRVELLGLPIDALTPGGLIEHVLTHARAGQGGYVMTPNLDHLHRVSGSAAMWSLAMAADVRVADGMSLVWASRLQGTPLPSRVAGSDLVLPLSRAAAREHLRVFLLGGDPGVAEAAADALARDCSSIAIAGTYCPPRGFEHDPACLEEIRRTLVQAAPDLVYLGLPFDKASAVVIATRASLPSAWYLGLGISLSFLSGHVRRAPTWLQRLGFEWAHRLTQEPARLWRRYLVEDLPFAARLFASVFIRRIRGHDSPARTAHEPPRPGVT